ncbi:MAG: hypothetical protein M1497_02465 [Nitrospirae bacterium]|nr:hypothetical protein [Nitrospirota bacterium]
MNNELREKVCERFCSYYKPSRAGESACLGFLVIQHLAGRDRVIEIPPPGAGQPGAAADRELCGYCGYRAGDCDFAAGIAGAPPCGGFVLIGLLLQKGIVTSAEVLDAARSLHRAAE